jgi:hypothetical protein
MAQNTYKIDGKFLLEGFEIACSEWKTKLQEKFPQIHNCKKYTCSTAFRTGDRFTIIGFEGAEYLLVQGALSKINFINLASGNRWTDEMPSVDNVNSITIDELMTLIGDMDCEGMTVNGKKVEYTVKDAFAEMEFEVDVEFIKEAHRAADRVWKSAIEKKFPAVFNDNLLLSAVGSMSITNIPLRIQEDVDIQVSIAQGYATLEKRKDLFNRAICVEGSDLADVEVIECEAGINRFMITFKKK